MTSSSGSQTGWVIGALLLVVVLIVGAVLAVTLTGSSGPERTVQSYMSAMSRDDCVTVDKLSSAHYLEAYGACTTLGDETVIYTFAVESTEITGDSAKVTGKMSFDQASPVVSDDSFFDDPSADDALSDIPLTVMLVKDNGTWLIDGVE